MEIPFLSYWVPDFDHQVLIVVVAVALLLSLICSTSSTRRKGSQSYWAGDTDYDSCATDGDHCHADSGDDGGCDSDD